MTHYYSMTNKISSALLSLAWFATSHSFNLVKYYWVHIFKYIWCAHTHIQAHTLCIVKSLITSNLQFLNGSIRINSLSFFYYWNIWVWFSEKSSGIESPIMTRKSLVSSFLNQVFSRGNYACKKYYLTPISCHPNFIIIKNLPYYLYIPLLLLLLSQLDYI